MNKKILDVLAFDQVKQLVGQYLVTAQGKEELAQLAPSADAQQISTWLAETEDALKVQRLRGGIPVPKIENIRPQMKRIEIGADLNGLELAQVGRVLVTANELKRFFEDLSDSEIEFERLYEWEKQLVTLPTLSRRLKEAVDEDGRLTDEASPELRVIRQNIRRSERTIRETLDSLVRGGNAKYLSDTIVTMRNERYVIPVKQEYRGVFGGVVHDQSSSGQTLFIEPKQVVDQNNRLRQHQIAERTEIERILAELSAELAPYQREILHNAYVIGMMDFMNAKARFGKELQAIVPAINTDNHVVFKQARHPLIDQEKVVPNDIAIGEDYQAVVITGPNTGGKTITLKTLGLLQIMGQSGLPILVDEESQMGIFQEIFADIGDEQSIEQSLSTFSSHINDIVAIMKNVDKNTLVLIDEIGAGTDPEEGASLAISILDFLRKKNAKIMVTTHYPELKLYGYNRPRTTNASMEFDLKTLSPTYNLQIGIPGHSNAFAIARRLGMREDVVKNAQSLIKDTDSDINKMIERLNAQTKAATTARQRLETSLDRAQKLEKKLQDALDWYNQRLQKQLDFAQERANEVVAKRRKKADKIIEELEKQRKNGAGIQENKLIDAKGELNSLERQAQNLANNKVLQREKRRHHVNVGDRVKVLSYGQTGTITKKLTEHEYEVQMGIIKVKVSDRDVEKIDGTTKKQKQPVRATSASLRRSNAHSELDLRGQRYDEAMTNLDRYIDSALLAGLSTVTIIHGIGTGAIRKGVWQYLRSSGHVKAFNYAPANEGGNGATIVQLK